MSCNKEPLSNSITPELSLTSAQVLPHPILPVDSIIILTFSYADADGDIGIPESDTLSGSDFIIRYFEIQDGEPHSYIIPLSANDTLNFNQRLPSLTPQGKDKSIKGTFTVRIPATPFPGYTPDSVMFQCRLFDRAGNGSQEVQTPILSLKH